MSMAFIILKSGLLVNWSKNRIIHVVKKCMLERIEILSAQARNSHTPLPLPASTYLTYLRIHTKEKKLKVRDHPKPIPYKAALKSVPSGCTVTLA